MNRHEELEHRNLEQRENQLVNEEIVIPQNIMRQDNVNQNINANPVAENEVRRQQGFMDGFLESNEAPMQNVPGYDAPEAIERGLYTPPNAIHRDLSKALVKISNWKNLKQRTSLPLKNAVVMLLEAKTTKNVTDAIDRIIDTSMNYMKVNAGHRSVLGSGEARKEDVRKLITELSVYAANNNADVMRFYGTKLSALENNFKYTDVIRSGFEKAFKDAYGGNIRLLDGCQRADEEKADMMRTINEWNGMKNKAETLLDSEKADYPQEHFRSKEVLAGNIDDINIPDVKNLSDFEILKHKALPDMRRAVLNPFKQNLNFLMATGALENADEARTMQKKLALLEKELDVYDARVRMLAGRAQEGDAELVKGSEFLEDLEKETEEDLLISADKTRELVQYKKLAAILEPGKKITKLDLAAREKIIDRKLAKKTYLSDAKKLAKDKSIRPSEAESEIDILAHYKAEGDRILGSDFSVLLDVDVTESGMLKNAVEKFELLSMLDGIDEMLLAVANSEEGLTDIQKRDLSETGKMLLPSEKETLIALSALSKKLRAYYDRTMETDEREGNMPICLEDYEALSEEQRKAFLKRPEGQNVTSDQLRVHELCGHYQGILDARKDLSDNILNLVNMINDRKIQIPIEKERLAGERQERLKKERQAALVKMALTKAKEKKEEKSKPKDLDYIDDFVNRLIDKHNQEVVLDLLKKDARMIITSYESLGEKGKTKEDATAVREKCLDAMLALTGFDKTELASLETEKMISLLKDVQGKKEFDEKAFKEEVRNLLDADIDCQAELSEIESLKRKKTLSVVDEQKLKEKSIKCFEKCIPDRKDKTRESLENEDINGLSEHAVSILKVYNIKIESEKNEKEIFKKTTIAALSRITGKKEAEFDFISFENLSRIFYESMARVGSKKFSAKKYVEDELTIEKRSKLISDASGSFAALDKEKAKEKDIEETRKKLVLTLSEITGAQESDFDLVGLEELSSLLNTASKNTRDLTRLKKAVDGDKSTLLKAHTLENYGKTIKEITSREGVSKEYIDYLIKEMSIDAYMKMGENMGFLDNKKKVSRKDFDDISGEKLSAIVLMGTEIAKFKEEELTGDEKELYRNANLSLVSSVLKMDNTYLEKMPTYELAEISKKLISSANSNKEFNEAISTSIDKHKERYKSGEFLKECGVLMDAYKKNKSNTYALDAFKELCVYYLMEVSRVADFTKEELLNMVPMDLYAMTITQHNADKANPNSALNTEDEDYEKTILGLNTKINEVNDFIKDLVEKRNKLESEAKLSRDPKEFELELQYLNESFNEQVIAKEQYAKTLLKIQGLARRNKEGYKNSEMKDALKAYKAELAAVQSRTDYGIKRDLIVRDRKKMNDWDEDVKDTLGMMGDLVSSEKFFYEDGSEAEGVDRIRFILSQNVENVTKILKGIDCGKKDTPLGVLTDNVTGTEGKLLKAATVPFFNKLLELIGKEYGDKKEINQALVQDFIKVKISDESLAELEKEMNGSMKAVGDVAFNSLISQAAEDLFGGEMEPISPYFDDPVEPEVKVEKTKEQLDKEKLKKLRDSVFDTQNGQGKFLYMVIKDYYAKAPEHIQKAMMSYLIKDLKPTKTATSSRTKGAEFFASMLKGAGPIMQKLFQGIPEHMLTEPFKPALSVVKSKLSQISPAYVDKKLVAIKDNANKVAGENKSNDKILEIKKLRSLGAASIAETFLCEVKYQNKPASQVVIKIMRPELNLRSLEKEKTFIEECALKTDETGVMLATFNAHYQKMKEELDMGNEKTNALMGAKAYNDKTVETGECVKSVNISGDIPSGDDYLVMDLAQGTTLDRYIEELSQFGSSKLKEFDNYDPETKKFYSVKPGDELKRIKIRKEIADKLVEAEKCHGHMEKLVEAWITKAFFTKTGNGYFHHGDLHSGNIMINEDQATVLDYGNCTVLENGSQISDIVNMMAAAFVGKADKFVEAMEKVLSREGAKNAFNNLPSDKKKATLNKLKTELDEIMKLGGSKNTGERIFASLLKTQQMGISLPQELQNFSQCQQRLENSLNEFTNAINKLRATLDTIDAMPITYPEGTRGESLDPIQSMFYSNSNPSSNEATKSAAFALYRSFEFADGNQIKKELSGKISAIDFENKNMEDLLSIKNEMITPEQEEFSKIKKNLPRWKKDYADYLRYKDVSKESIKDKKEKKRYDEVMKISEDFLGLLSFFSAKATLLDIAGMGDLTTALAIALKGSNEHFNRVEQCLEKLFEIDDLTQKYQTFKESKKDKHGKVFIDQYVTFNQKYMLENTYINKIKNKISPDLNIDTYYRYTNPYDVIDRVEKDMEAGKGDTNQYLMETENSTKEKPEYVYGEHSRKIRALAIRFRELDKNKKVDGDPKLKHEKEVVGKELCRLCNLMITRKAAQADKTVVEKDLKKYLDEDSVLGKTLRAQYNDLRKLQEEYFEIQVKGDNEKELTTVRNKRVKADKEFLTTFAKVMNKYVKPISDQYLGYVSYELYSFVDMMSSVLSDHATSVLSMLGTDTFMYKKAIKKIQKQEAGNN